MTAGAQLPAPAQPGGPAERASDEAARPAGDLPDGIYFGLDEGAYHALKRLSSSGVRNLLISPLDFWVASPFNPDYEDKKTPEMILGTALHRRLLEPERFKAIYAAVPSRDDHPDAIDGVEALRAECERLGVKKTGKTSDLCARILEKEPGAKLWPALQERALSGLKGKTLLKPDSLRDIERTARIVLAHRHAAMALAGGVAEATVLWTDEESGVPMKARLDYLKTKITVDIKSFGNPLGKPLRVAVASAMALNRYGVQAVIYSQAVEAAKRMLRERKSEALHGGEAISNDWLVALAACERHGFAFVFIETGQVNNVVVREFRPREFAGGSANLYWEKASHDFRYALARYVECVKAFGHERPWIEDTPMQPFVDSDFPMWMFEGA